MGSPLRMECGSQRKTAGGALGCASEASASTSTRCASLPRARTPPQRSRAFGDAARAPAALPWRSMDPMQRAARHAMRMAGTTALQDLLAEVAGRRREAHDTAARSAISPALAARGLVLAARMMARFFARVMAVVKHTTARCALGPPSTRAAIAMDGGVADTACYNTGR